MSRPVRPADRARDAVATVLLVGGAALFVYAHLALRELARRPVPTATSTALQQFARYERLSQVGLLLVAAGLAAVVWSFWRYRRPDSPNR